MKAAFEAGPNLQKSLQIMRGELWRVESQFKSCAIGPGKDPNPIPRFGNPPPAVNVAGMVESEKGVGEALRSTLRSLEAAGVPFVLNNFVDPGSENLDLTYSAVSKENPHRINLLHIGPDIFSRFLNQTPAGYLDHRLNIACWAWEISEFPARWESHFQYLDEIWVPSNFSLDAISRISPVPVVRIPHSLPEWLPVEPATRADFEIPADAFVFLYVFDLASSAARKNPMGVVRAFRSAFGSDDRAVLVLKCVHADADPAAATELAHAAQSPNIKLIDRILPRVRVNALLNLCDCYVSLHRSEGFGLTIAEAMSLGKPVIATDYSGNTDFMNGSNSFPVRYQLTEIQDDVAQYKMGTSWADPDLDHAAELMRHVYENQQSAAHMGQIARRDIVHHLNPYVVGEIIKNRLRRFTS